MKCKIVTREEMENTLIERHGQVVQNKLKNAVVGIAGIGGLGSNVALSLARIGIGKLIIADFDVVDMSNLNRQQYFINQLGMKKVDALEEVISKCNPFVGIKKHDVFLTENNIEEIFKEADVIVEACDRPEVKAIITNTILTKMKDTKLVIASGMAGYYTGNTIVSKKLRENLYFVGDGENESKPGSGLMAPRVAIAANHQANTVVRIILGEE
ncbi:sulfur carrier protein ThiS adenylyltransferase ThiF [Clostridium massiliodielmoense]|uniref:sulfur carrier protein ThiS adenylyltransferase ThiF n=1 Tax=Clostridium massiliodielmoense TaxID=1776385 RepID=UPI000166A3F4|nr:sulfur carrier protein ThiS adenylyltransferase ThiF [Clostridium massiliodielmoense]EDS78646.1 thiamine biosynthesis protein ThiF [Clostridium botulinum C str. Eklund]KEH98812.1 thiamine biosynthesis protein ThiF [Clostridium botulinum C/D str. BKT12695]NEZ48131.1 sulfur carrier protein ThiS adenylyltransferase ThiF [Clostridium botulinum]